LTKRWVGHSGETADIAISYGMAHAVKLGLISDKSVVAV
jgi:hypothetical protein